jgi:hypothetical protein
MGSQKEDCPFPYFYASILRESGNIHGQHYCLYPVAVGGLLLLAEIKTKALTGVRRPLPGPGSGQHNYANPNGTTGCRLELPVCRFYCPSYPVMIIPS